MSQLLAVYMGSLMLRSIGIAVIAGVFTWKMRNAAARHAVWVAVLGAILLMPIVDFLLPATWVPARIQTIGMSQAAEIRAVAEQSGSTTNVGPLAVKASEPARVNVRSIDWWEVAAAVYFTVAGVLFSMLVVGYWKIRKLMRSGRIISGSIWNETGAPYRTRRRLPELRESDEVRVPITIGVFRPVVMLPAGWQTWDDWKLRAVLLHELAHVRRADWAIAAIAAVAKCAFWLNPLSWFLERRLATLAEQCSDDASLARVQDTTRYAEVLLEFAAVAGNGGRFLKRGMAMAQHKMHARIERVLNNSRSGNGVMRFASWMAVVLLAMPVLYSAAALQVGTKPVSDQPQRYETSQANRDLVETRTHETSQNPFRSETQNRHADVKESRMESSQAMLQQADRISSAGALSSSQEGQRDNSNGGGDYLIKPNDGLKIVVYKVPDLSADVAVQPDGRISMPLLQGIQAAGLSADQLKASIEKRLREYIESPIVSVMVSATQSYRVFVIGKVQRSGPLTSEKPITILQALALAGGFQEFAMRDKIAIVRTLPPQGVNQLSQARFNFNYDEVIRGINQMQDFVLIDGDVITVP